MRESLQWFTRYSELKERQQQNNAPLLWPLRGRTFVPLLWLQDTFLKRRKNHSLSCTILSGVALSSVATLICIRAFRPMSFWGVEKASRIRFVEISSNTWIATESCRPYLYGQRFLSSRNLGLTRRHSGSTLCGSSSKRLYLLSHTNSSRSVPRISTSFVRSMSCRWFRAT
jgi:hypothetical protein